MGLFLNKMMTLNQEEGEMDKEAQAAIPHRDPGPEISPQPITMEVIFAR